MRKVFWDDPYQCSLTTKVETVDGNKVLLEETIAFSFSGGQESDKDMAWTPTHILLDGCPCARYSNAYTHRH